MTIASNLHVESDMRRCIDQCLECHAICEHCAVHCLEMGGHHAGKDHQVTMRDCAQICQTAADFMIRSSPLHAEVCRACAAVCERCAEQCRSMADGDEMMLRCAEICRKCAESCQSMAKTSGAYTA